MTAVRGRGKRALLAPLAAFLLVFFVAPLVWLLSLPFRLVGIAVEGVFELLRAIVMLPARVLGGRPR